MIGFVEHDLGAAEIGQPGSCAERQVLEVGIRVVDDFRAEFDRILRRLTGARGIAGQRINDADLDVGCVSGHRRPESQNVAAANTMPCTFVPPLFDVTPTSRIRVRRILTFVAGQLTRRTPYKSASFSSAPDSGSVLAGANVADALGELALR